jgi:hypothetical protein
VTESELRELLARHSDNHDQNLASLKVEKAPFQDHLGLEASTRIISLQHLSIGEISQCAE